MVSKGGTGLASVGVQVASWRRARGLTQTDLEARAGLAHNALSRIENDRVSPRLGSLERIARALDLTVEELQFRRPPQAAAESLAPDTAKLIARLDALSEDRRKAVLAAFNALLDQMRDD